MTTIKKATATKPQFSSPQNIKYLCNSVNFLVQAAHGQLVHLLVIARSSFRLNLCGYSRHGGGNLLSDVHHAADDAKEGGKTMRKLEQTKQCDDYHHFIPLYFHPYRGLKTSSTLCELVAAAPVGLSTRWSVSSPDPCAAGVALPPPPPPAPPPL